MARRPKPLSPGEAQPADDPAAEPVVREVTYAGVDGLTLFARDYGDRLSPWLPVVCLAGLTRSSRDFHDLAIHLSAHRHRPRRVVAFDYRGRGRSQWGGDPETYNPVTEMADVFDGMAALGIGRAVVVGTSRGGIIGMLMGVARPATVAALVLNDVGPVIEAIGLARIKSYVGRTPMPSGWADAAAIQRRLHGSRFTGWTEEDWDRFARLTYRAEGDLPAPDYDPALALTFDGVEFDRPVPNLWYEFRALRATPVLVIRGENSDLLSEVTVGAMKDVHTGVEAVTVPGEGHPPLLRGGSLLGRISAFITAAEGAGPPAESVIPRAEAGYSLDQPSEAPPEAS